MRQFYRQHGRLDSVHPTVATDDRVTILRYLAVIRNEPGSRGGFGIVCNDRTGVPKRSEILARIKAECGGIAERSDFLPFVRRPMRLCAIFEDLEAMLLSDGHYLIHLGREPVQMDRYDGPS